MRRSSTARDWSTPAARTATSTPSRRGTRASLTPRQKIFLKEALGAAYTPLSIGEDGKVYSQNDGHLFVVGR